MTEGRERSHQLMITLDTSRPAYVAAEAATAMSALHELFAARAYNVALRVLRQPADAEDVVQDVLFAVWKGSKRYDPSRGSPIRWLTVVVRNQAIDLLRQRAALASISQSPAQMPEQASATPEDCVAQLQGHTRLLRGLEALPPDQRTVLELGYFQGFSHTEISSRTGTPLGTVKSRGRAGLLGLAQTIRTAA